MYAAHELMRWSLGAEALLLSPYIGTIAEPLHLTWISRTLSAAGHLLLGSPWGGAAVWCLANIWLVRRQGGFLNSLVAAVLTVALQFFVTIHLLFKFPALLPVNILRGHLVPRQRCKPHLIQRGLLVGRASLRRQPKSRHLHPVNPHAVVGCRSPNVGPSGVVANEQSQQTW